MQKEERHKRRKGRPRTASLTPSARLQALPVLHCSGPKLRPVDAVGFRSSSFAYLNQAQAGKSESRPCR
eukprot:scaffold1060_cov246-Pinguiococcus_pyrenoidosus.AAC.21